MRDSRSLSLSLCFSQCPFFQKNSRPFFFSKKIFSPFSLRFVLVSPHCRTRAHTHARTSRAKETNGEKMDGARVLLLFFLSVSLFVISLILSLLYSSAFSHHFFEFISSSFFPNNNNNLSFICPLSQNDRRRGVPRQPARRFRRRRFRSFERREFGWGRHHAVSREKEIRRFLEKL